MRNCPNLFKSIIFIISISLSASLIAEKTVITAADQLPRIAYPFTGNVIELFEDADRLQSYLDLAEKDRMVLAARAEAARAWT